METIIEDISGNRAFTGLQYADAEVPVAIKAGILPYCRNERGDMVFLFQRAIPTREEDLGKELPFQIARGSRRLASDKKIEIRTRADALQHGVTHENDFVPAFQEAIKEGWEELGIVKRNIRLLKDCGTLNFNGTHETYGIHLILAEMSGSPLENTVPRDSEEVRWMTLAEARELAETGNFKTHYLPMLEAVAAALDQGQRRARMSPAATVSRGGDEKRETDSAPAR